MTGQQTANECGNAKRRQSRCPRRPSFRGGSFDSTNASAAHSAHLCPTLIRDAQTEGDVHVRVTENELHESVLANARDAQGVIVELVWRLVCASAPQPKQRRFPLGDSMGQPGPDGILEVEISHAFVPNGLSFWEIGTSRDAGSKATDDYRDRTADTPEDVRKNSTFVFVTPLSASFDWQYTWKGQQDWLKKRREKKEWKDVRVIDGTVLADWLSHYPSVARWFAKRALSRASEHLETVEERWELTRSFGEPPPLAAQLFLTRREEAKSRLAQVISGEIRQLRLSTRYPEDIVNFVAAYIASLDDDARVETSGRCLIVSSPEAWKSMAMQSQPLILVADSNLDLTGDPGGRLIQAARRGKHAIVFGEPPGGVPDPLRASLPSPSVGEIEQALKTVGYPEQRARGVATRSGGNLPALLRCLQDLSAYPAWAEKTAAAELAIAALIGSWDESIEGDVRATENLSGKEYGEWIGHLRDLAQLPDTPLIHQDSQWKFVLRYEGWSALGRRIFDDHLDRFAKTAMLVLAEPDPQFDFAPEKRLEAQVSDKQLQHSRRLRSGLAETLALLGSYPGYLSATSLGKPQETARRVVFDLLNTADWNRWASLNDVLPLLAEAAPEEFLRCVEAGIDAAQQPFVSVFAQESPGIGGQNYMTGLLWGLESLAWSPDYLVQVVRLLAGLAERDPGGNWGNRPLNSLQTIFLPWLPQTCANSSQRLSAVGILTDEHPDVGWRLLVNLLPDVLSSSSYTHRPMWRPLVPEDWTPGVTNGEYRTQIEGYSDLVVRHVTRDAARLSKIIGHFHRLSERSRASLLGYMRSSAFAEADVESRIAVWKALTKLVAEQRRHPDVDWALPVAEVTELSQAASDLKPSDPGQLYRRLFENREFELFDGLGDYEEQLGRLESQREQAVLEIESKGGGTPAVLQFAKQVEQPGQAGAAYGRASGQAADADILPDLLGSEDENQRQFVGGFIWGRFRRQGSTWVDGLHLETWTKPNVAQFLSFLPFSAETWERAAKHLGPLVGEYWNQANVNPFQAGDDLEQAVIRLLENGRPRAAADCLHIVLRNKKRLEPALALRTLRAIIPSNEARRIPDYEIVEIIKSLQNDSSVSVDELARIEWAFLPLLNDDRDAAPHVLEGRLASDPAFFCEIIRLVFRSTKEKETVPAESSPEQRAYATNGYRLLQEWTMPPGMLSDGTFDAAQLESWLAAVQNEATASGHLEVALLHAGQVLTHVPPDPTGLWIDRGAARILDSKENDRLREGFRIELYNSRGVHWVDPSGSQEEELAALQRRRAEELAAAGFHRLATTMRDLAKSYERDAERVRTRESSEI